MKSTAPRSHYPFDNTAPQAATRLASLSELYDEVTFRHLDRCGIGPGWKCLEVGAGGGSVAAFMGGRVGPTGEVIATDITTGRMTGPFSPAVAVLRHDIGVDPLPPGTFDVIHARAVLSFVPQRRAVLARLISALKPAGWLLVEELAMPAVDPFARPGDPGVELADRARRAIIQVLHCSGADLHFALEVRHTLADSGLCEIGAEGFFHPFRTDAVAALTRANLDQLRGQIVELGLMSALEMDRYHGLLDDSDVHYPASMALISVWGQRDVT